MSGAKIKNLIILILALTAAFLLALVIPLRLSQSKAERAQHEQIAALYARDDVQLDSAILPRSATLYTIELASGGEDAAAKALLGDGAARSSDATRYAAVYTSEAGRCEFSRAGGFYAALTDGPHAGDAARHAKKFLHQMGYDAASVATTETDNISATLTATQSLLGVPVFDQTLTLTYMDGALQTLSGSFFTGSDSITRVSESACVPCADALLALLRGRDQLGWVGSRIDRVLQGYVYTETASGALRFVPGWRIETDTGAFFVNGITREVRAAQ